MSRNTLLRIVGWVLYFLIIVISILCPFLWGLGGLRKVNTEVYIYRFFPSWAKWIVEAKYVFWR